MAKKPPQQVKVSLNGECQHIHHAIYKHITIKPDALRFLHLERKGNTWLLLDAIDWPNEEWDLLYIPFIRTDAAGMIDRKMTIVDKEVDIRAYTVIHLPDQAFYHLDELPDGSWRITHSDGLLHCDHNTIESFTVRKV